MYEKVAFSGAEKNAGYFEAANYGTLFLDEKGELRELQNTLTRVSVWSEADIIELNDVREAIMK